jgi:SAM-dependent methyltransferase
VTSDRERWDLRHAAERERPPGVPDPFVVAVLDELGAGDGQSALDLACGVGRHAQHLATRGYRVSGWDVSPVALEILSTRAEGRIATRQVDLMTEAVFEEVYDVMVVVDFLSRPLFQSLHLGLKVGGSVIVTTFSEDFPGSHPSPRFRVKRGELQSLPELTTRRALECDGRAGIWAVREPR